MSQHREWTVVDVVDELQRLRCAAGEISYQDIAVRIAASRQASGRAAGAARIARSTVYDAFRADRARLNPDLIGEIAEILTDAVAERADADASAQVLPPTVVGAADHSVARAWRDRAVAANRAMRGGLDGKTAGEVAAVRARNQPVSLPAPVRSVGPATSGRPQLRALPDVPRAQVIITVLLACVLLNVVGGRLVIVMSLPIYLDMIGTAVAAITLGPWGAIAAATLTHVAGAMSDGSLIGMPYLLVNITGGLLWAYGVRSWGLGRTPGRFLALNVLVAVACTAVAAPITIALFDGLSIHRAGYLITQILLGDVDDLATAAILSNLMTSTLDKLVTGFIALPIAATVLGYLPVTRGARRGRAVSFRGSDVATALTPVTGGATPRRVAATSERESGGSFFPPARSS